jgi:hypothetical protein
MVTDIRKVITQVAAKRYILIDIEPFFAPDVTRLNIAKVPDDGEEIQYLAGIDFQADLLAYISDKDLQDYLVVQVDRILEGKPVQSIRVRR